ncbi:hypothetical protein EDB19DRAFT_1828732 [Suillus lakei]|nr:hypothetical protein EDB19DRAFT_1828732 [Suillus lakei]
MVVSDDDAGAALPDDPLASVQSASFIEDPPIGSVSTAPLQQMDVDDSGEGLTKELEGMTLEVMQDSGNLTRNAPENGSKPPAQVELEGNVTQQATYEEIVAAFLNALAACLVKSQPELDKMRYATSTWSAASAQKPLPGSDIKRKPDLVLSDDILAKWGNIRVSAEITHSQYQPTMQLGKVMDTHAYLMMSEQPWRCFALILSFTDKYHHLRVLMYDHSGGTVSPCFNIYTQPHALLHIIATIKFGNLECVGYDSTVTFSRTVSPSRSKDIYGYHPIRNAPAQRSMTDNAVAASTSDSLPFPEDPDGVSSSDALESRI